MCRVAGAGGDNGAPGIITFVDVREDVGECCYHISIGGWLSVVTRLPG